ncbi:MAG TPA: GIY-YIG nuclease family protein [bacterium]|nr:GIY-YIG nuclease family protein [bacterium]HPP30541.1 GIY-YIG nuclease family protein [bacterium]
MYWVYVIKNKEGKIYIGQTKDLEKRLEYHNRGWSRYTRGKGRWEVIIKEKYSSRTEAIKREKELKTGKGREYIKEVIKIKTTGRGSAWFRAHGSGP